MTPLVWVARPRQQSARLLALLDEAGYAARHCPLMDIAPLPAALAALPTQALAADALVFVSPSAIDLAWPMLAGLDLSSKILACVGASSAQKLSRLSGRTVLHPQQGSDSEALLALPELAALAGLSFLIVRGEGGRPTLAQTLAQRGARVDFAELYRRDDGAPDWQAFDERPPDAVVLSSTQMVEQWFRLAGPAREATLQCLIYCVPHPRIAEQLAAHGAARIVTTRAEDEALVAGLTEWFSQHP